MAVFLLVGMLLPSALQAKHLVDFCMMEMMSHHEMMDDSHDCCLPKSSHHSNSETTNHDCENGQICACPINEAPIKDQATVPSAASSKIILPPKGFNFIVTSPDEFIHKEFYALANPDAPPLYLLYDTFLN